MPDVARLLEADITSVDQLLREIESAIRHRTGRLFVGIYPSLSLVYRASARYRSILASARTYPDGTGITWSMAALGSERLTRMPTTDVIWPLLALAEAKAWRVVLYGAAPGVAETATAAMTLRHPHLDVVGCHHGYEEMSQRDVATSRADLLLVARGAPRQEVWAQDVAIPAGVPAVVTCGGLFDFLSGDARRAPVWMRNAGLEWLYRVLREPGRLAKRYAFGNSLFVWWTLKEVTVRRVAQVVRRSS